MTLDLAALPQRHSLQTVHAASGARAPDRPFAADLGERGVGATPQRNSAATGTRLLHPLIDTGAVAAVQQSGAAPRSEAMDLNEAERRQVAQLKARDVEVRRHEQAHANTGGVYAGTPSYSFERGPDGRSYAVGGTTPIDASPFGGDPEATMRKMEQVRRAALAPGDPSPQDQRIAGQAEAQRIQAQAEAARVRADETAESRAPEAGEPGQAPREADAERPRGEAKSARAPQNGDAGEGVESGATAGARSPIKEVGMTAAGGLNRGGAGIVGEPRDDRPRIDLTA